MLRVFNLNLPGKPLALAVTATSALTASAFAQSEPSSAYVQVDACPIYQLEGEPLWESACPGYEGWSMFFLASEHSNATAYSYNGSERTAFYAPTGRFQFGNFQTTVEWRIRDGGPYATIYRYVSIVPTDALGDKGTDTGADLRQDLLVVTALTPNDMTVACPLFVVDASTITEAHVAARLLADSFAPGHVCDGREPVLFTDMAEVYDTLETIPIQELGDAQSEAPSRPSGPKP